MNQKTNKKSFLTNVGSCERSSSYGWFVLTGMQKGCSCTGTEFFGHTDPERKALETRQQDLLKHSMVFFHSYLRKE